MKASGSSYQVRAYNIRHGYNVNGFLEAYRRLLQKAIDEIWAGIRWIEEYDKKGRKRLIPVIPKGNSFKNHYLRSLLMDGWSYSKHYVDSAINRHTLCLNPGGGATLKEKDGERNR